MKVISVSAEIAPWSKTGGLGDVAAALPVALAQQGCRVMSVAPRYASYEDAWDTGVDVRFDGHVLRCFHKKDHGVDRIFVDHPALARGGIYGGDEGVYVDNWFRFSLLARAALLAASELKFDDGPFCDARRAEDTLFLVHDWHAALLPAYLKTAQTHGMLMGAKTALVIHNLAHQGIFDWSILQHLNLPDDLQPHLDMSGHLNMLKGAIALSDRIVTVSPTYAKEICTSDYGMGLEGVLRARRQHLKGILNGVDLSAWNPETDPHIESHFSATDMQGKRECKAALQRELGLRVDPKKPIFAFISRLDAQKGVGLIEAVLPWLLHQDVQVVMLGTGAPNLEAFFRRANRHPNVSAQVRFSNPLAHRITSGADFFLMPSLFEPCGLTQQHALLYGAVPIVHNTGGLADTVSSFNPWNGTGNGWVFSPFDATPFQQALAWALHTYRHHPKDFNGIINRGMSADRGWSEAAKHYSTLFRDVLSIA